MRQLWPASAGSLPSFATPPPPPPSRPRMEPKMRYGDRDDGRARRRGGRGRAPPARPARPSQRTMIQPAARSRSAKQIMREDKITSFSHCALCIIRYGFHFKPSNLGEIRLKEPGECSGDCGTGSTAHLPGTGRSSRPCRSCSSCGGLVSRPRCTTAAGCDFQGSGPPFPNIYHCIRL